MLRSMDSVALWVIGMDGHSSISDHGFRPGGRHNDLLITLCQGIGKGSQHAKLYLLLVTWHIQLGRPRNVLIVYLSANMQSEAAA